jgi:thioredoxin 1
MNGDKSTEAGTASGLWVICLCADWCGLCREYQDVFTQVAGQKDRHEPASRFALVDVEDQSDLAGDLDIETFPTLLVADSEGVLFLGTLIPHAGTLSRLLASLQVDGAKRAPHSAVTEKLLLALPALPELWI